MKTDGDQSPSTEPLRAAALEEIIRRTGKDPLVAFAEAACGALECTACNGTGQIQRPGQIQGVEAQHTCRRCHGTRREKVSPAAMLAARYKLATFFYSPRKPVEASEPERQPPQRVLTVRFLGRDGDDTPEPA